MSRLNEECRVRLLPRIADRQSMLPQGKKLEQEKAQLSARVEELKVKCAELTESCVERQAELDDANGKLKRLRRRVRRFKDAGQEAIAEIESLKKENSMLKGFVLERDKIIARQNQNIIAANIVRVGGMSR
jgi:chromosome segregation ATPase